MIIYLDMTPEESQKKAERSKQQTIARFIEESKIHTLEESRRIWELLTSRGKDRFIYGDMPSPDD